MDREVSLFGGAAGRVLSGAVSFHSLISGLALGLVLVVMNGVLIYAKALVLVTPLTQLILAFALARFVLNGQFGEWRGTLFSSVGGNWSAVSVVAARYLMLTGLWVVPMMIFGVGMEQAVTGAGMPGARASVPLALYIVVSTLSPPLFLTVSVTAADFGELFSPEHWKRTFGGRLVDLLSIYAVYAGGVTMAVLLSLPIIVLGFQPGWKLGVLCLALCGCFVFGLCLNLLGRLCGFFALGDFTCPADAGPVPALLPDPGLAPSSSGPQPRPAVTAPAGTDAVREPIPLSTLPAGREQARAPASVPSASPAQAPHPATAPDDPDAARAVATPPARPPLLDASKRIDPILGRFRQDPAGALRALEDLRDSFAPHPQVLVALCVCRHRNGDVEQAVQLAQTVVPICFERGHVQLAAQVFKQLRREFDRLGFNREQILIVGDALAKKGDPAGAGAAYSIAIGRDPGETRAVKGLLQIAGNYLNERDRPEAALKVYDYLLKHCSDSPLSEFMREGQARCHKRLAQPVG